MKIGDSFFTRKKSVLAGARAFTKRHSDYVFTTREEGDGFRIWRVAKKG
jgi:hypothetical protein